LRDVDEPAIQERASQLEQIQTARLALDSEPIKGNYLCTTNFSYHLLRVRLSTADTEVRILFLKLASCNQTQLS